MRKLPVLFVAATALGVKQRGFKGRRNFRARPQVSMLRAMKRIPWLLVVPLLALAAALAHAQALQRVATVEGLTEYRLPSGLPVRAVPDPSLDIVTRHLTVLVRPRHQRDGHHG